MAILRHVTIGARPALSGAVLVALLFMGCQGTNARMPSGQADVEALAALPWDSVVARARGTRVVWRMWRGDPAINAYVDRWVAPQVKARFDIELEAVDGYGPSLINAIVTEREAGRNTGTASLLW
ncbi:MAG: hypothetical protein ABIZ91_19220, partial [Gemmatimonadaceae bacterium]